MKAFKTLDIVRLFGGVIGMSQAQADLRKLQIKPAGRGTYEIIKPVEFKAGEIIRLPEVPKALSMLLEEMPIAGDQGQK